MKRLLVISSWLAGIQLLAQDSTKGTLVVSGYVEAYFSYDFNRPINNNRPGFIYSQNRHNEFTINLAFLKGSYNAEKIRANFALASGTYINANYVSEPGVLKNIYEANAGVKLSKNKNLWLDAGILGSHIGFETAVSKDCWNVTRSILAENSPYYEAGAKFTYTADNGKWMVSGLALNGWQRITRLTGNSMMSWGTQIQFKPSDKVLLNYSSFIGTDKPDSTRLLRLFHNLYGIIALNSKISLTLGFDIGTEEKSTGNGVNTWYSPVSILKYTFSHKWALATRAEYYRDTNGVIIVKKTPNGFQTTGYSLNIDYAPAKNALIRMELRNLNSKDKVFVKENGMTRNNTFITTSIAISF